MMLITQIMQLRKQKHPTAIDTDTTALAVTQNASNPAVTLKHNSKGSSEQDQDVAETTHPPAIITDATALAVTQNASNPAIILKHGSKGSSEQDQDTTEITDAAVAIGSEKTNPPHRVEQTKKCEERIEQ